MKAVIPIGRFHEGNDRCPEHGKQSFSCEFISIDHTTGMIVFFLCCDVCWEEAQDKTKVMGWKIEYPIEDWLKYYTVRFGHDN